MNRKAISEPTLSLDRERGIAGVLTARRSGHVREIDWNSLLFGKKVLTDQELADAGLEAPRNSLESSPGTRTPRFSGVRHDDIPYGFEIPKTALIPDYSGRSGEMSYSRSGSESGKKLTAAPAEVLPIKMLIAQDSCEAELERKRRSAPSVVARLMGLDSLPDKYSRGSYSTAKPPKPSKSSSSSHGSRRDTKPHSARAETSSRPPSPLHDVDTIKDFPLPRSRGQIDSDVYEEKTKIDVLPFRAHPQEKQLQEFKREFMEKLATQRHRPPPGASRDPEVEEKRRQLRQKLSEAKLALAGGGNEASRLSSAQEKLMESKEFQDAIELLQTNKEFFKKFFPETKSLTSGNKDPPEPESTSRRSFHLEDLCEDSARYDDTSRRSFHLGEFSRDSRKSYFLNDSSKESSRKSFNLDDLSKESRKSLVHSHDSPKESSGRKFHWYDSRRSHNLDDVSKEIRALEDYTDSRLGGDVTGSTGRTQSSSELRRRRETKYKSSVANPVAEELIVSQRSCKVPSMDKEVSFWPTPEHISSTGRHGSPNNLDPRKGCDSPSRIVVLKPGPGDITILTPVMAPNCSPRTYRIVGNPRGDLFEARADTYRDHKERCSPPRVQETGYPKVHCEDYRVDPRAIARDIVREARTNSTREISRERETGRRDSPRPVDSNVTRTSGSTGKKLSIPKFGYGLEEIPGSVEVGSFTLAALSRRHQGKEGRSSPPTVPNPSQRTRAQEVAATSERSCKEGKPQQRRSSEKPKAVSQAEQPEEEQHQSNGAATTEARKASTHVNDIYRAAAMARSRQYLPGIKAPGSKGRADPILENQIRPDDWNNSVGVNMYTTLPSTDKIVKVEGMYYIDDNRNGGEESKDNSPRALSNSRSTASAILMVNKTRSADTPNRIASTGNQIVAPERVEVSEHFFLKEKRAESRQVFFSSKKRFLSGDTSTSGRLGSIQAQVLEQHTVVQDVHIDTNVGSPLVSQPYSLSVMNRTSFENALPIEGGARHGVRACEKELLEALSQLTPQTLSYAKDNSETDPYRKLSIHQQVEAPGNKHASNSSKAWSIATETLENADGDGASETSVDKCGQPSPVSVLDSPFEAEIPSPVDFKELTSDLQDLRLRLRLLKLDDSDRSGPLWETFHAKEKLVSQNPVVRHTDNSFESTEGTGGNFSIDGELKLQARHFEASHCAVDEIDIGGLPCPEGKKEDLIYVLNLLLASGLTESSTMTIARWHSPMCPLDPGLYERLEDQYAHGRPQFAEENGNFKSKGCSGSLGNQDSFSRRLLFDVVNEVLVQILGPYMSYRPWVQPRTPLLRPLPTNQQLVRYIWFEICTCFSPKGAEDFEALDYLMARDVSRGGPWLDSREIREEIGLELERIIFDSLLEETVHSFVLATK